MPVLKRMIHDTRLVPGFDNRSLWFVEDKLPDSYVLTGPVIGWTRHGAVAGFEHLATTTQISVQEFETHWVDFDVATLLKGEELDDYWLCYGTAVKAPVMNQRLQRAVTQLQGVSMEDFVSADGTRRSDEDPIQAGDRYDPKPDGSN